jgi:RNA polymerase sigma-70 factor (ECF subfamily)
MREASERVARLYDEESPRLWRALVGFTGDRELASDSVADAFALALQHESAIHDLRAWIWTVAFRLAAAELRRAVPQLEDDIGSSDVDSFDAVPELVRALQKLSPKQRLAIVLHDYADRPTAEVADVLGCSRATVHVHLSKGRKRLRGSLEVRDA